jgi:hypothetical protein
MSDITKINQNMPNTYLTKIMNMCPIENTMDVLKVSHKGKNLDILEQFHIYKAANKKKSNIK